MDDFKSRILGCAGIRVGRLGVACSYGAPAAAFEMAFERGVNYFYWGSLRKTAMVKAIRNIVASGRRDELVVVIQSYARFSMLMERFYRRALNTLGIDSADILLLGWHQKAPSPRLLERAVRMRDKGMFRYLAVSGHDRTLFPKLAETDGFDVFHVRYNAVHRGAETDIFDKLPKENRPGVVTYTATRWGDLLKSSRMPTGEAPLSGADCYRFVLSHPDVDVCMTGPATTAQMQEALTALEMGPLSDSEMVRIRRIGDHVHTHHKRLMG